MQSQNFAKNSNFSMITSDRATTEPSEVVKEVNFMEQQTKNAYFEADQSQRVQDRATDEFISSKEKEERPNFLSEVLSEHKVEQANVLPLETSDSKRIPERTAAPEILSRNPLLIPHNLLKVEEEPVAYPSKSPNCCLRGFKSRLRGGSPQGDNEEAPDVNYSELLAKFQQYKEKMLNDVGLEKELNLFVEVLASNIPSNQDHDRANTENKSDENQHLELSFDIRRRLLRCEDSKDSKILLLTGQAGSGKSLFCKYFQRQILSEWSQNPEAEDRNWFPIYVELSSLKNPKSEAISEYLSRELSLSKEEILLLQVMKQSNPLLPRLLFIFDGYDTIEDFQALHSLRGRKDFLDNNFFMFNKIQDASWKDAKFIITCREENLQKVQRRDMLFAPLINYEATELLAVPGSFLQRKIDPFSDEQITCYLKKYHYYDSKDKAEEASSSWNQVKKLEKMIDNYQLREIARIPFMLWIIYQILPKFVKSDSQVINEAKLTHPQRLSKFSLIDFFVDEVIISVTKQSLDASNSLENKEEHKAAQREEKDMNLHLKEIRQQAKDLALKLRGYFINQVVTECAMNDKFSTMKLYPLVKWDDNHSQVKFGYPHLLEFFVAKSIEEEIREVVPSTQDGQLEIKKELLINQRFLTREASDAAVIFFLIDAIKDERLTANQLINLIHLSRQKEFEQKNDGESIKDVHQISELPFTLAAANAITILNAAGYDFSGNDLSHIRIPGANLSYGTFVGTNFASSNLKGVDFDGARLKKANFVKANLESIEFGSIKRLKLRNERILNIAYSPDGKYFAVDIGDETVIFENVGFRKFYLEEKRRFPGHFLSWGALDGIQVVTVVGEQVLTKEKQTEEQDEDNKQQDIQNDQKEKLNACFCIWDAISGQSIQKFNVRTIDKRIPSFNLERKEVTTIKNQQAKKYHVTSDFLIKLPFTISNGVTNFDLVAKNNSLLPVGAYQIMTILRNLTIGKPILKQRQKVASCNISLNGKQNAVGTSSGVIYISDFVRGCIIKSLINTSKNDKLNAIDDFSFDMNGKQILAKIGNTLTLLDIADPKLTNFSLTLKKLNTNTYCLSPDGQKIAVVEDLDTISFYELPMVADLSIQTPSVRGKNNKGLNLQRIIANISINLSEENIAFFQEKGDYGRFNDKMIKRLFCNSLTDSKEITEVALIAEKLSSIHARIIGSDILWINLQTLDLSRNNIGEEGGKAIGNNKVWTNLEQLILMSTEIGDETAEAIANNQKFQKLKKLQLSFNKIGDFGAKAIGNNKIWTNLEQLILMSTEIGDQTAEAIANNQKFQKLKKLQLSFNKIGDFGAKAIGKNEIWMGLEILDLCHNKIKADGALAIGSNNIWKKLVTLDLSSNKIKDKQALIFLCSNKTWECLQSLLLVGNPALLQTSDIYEILKEIASKSLNILALPQGKLELGLLESLKYPASESIINFSLAKSRYHQIFLKTIAEFPTFKNLSTELLWNEIGIQIGRDTSWINLEELDLSSNNLGAQTAVAIGGNTSWSKLRVLNLNGNKIRSEGSYAIGNNKTWTELQTLELKDNLIGSKGVVALCQNKTWNKLQTLNLEKNLIDVEGTAELARNMSWINLQTLHLDNNSIGDKGAAELGRNTSWINLQTLHLDNNSIGDKGAAELGRNTSWINLQTLHLQYNSIGDKGAAELGRNTSWINLHTLDLNNNSIGDKGAAELGRNTSWINLQTIHLQFNSIGDKGAAELGRNTSWINLQILHLYNNSTGAEGAANLAKNTSWINLQTLHLYNNSIGAEGAAELGRNTSWINLQTLHLYNNSIGAEGAAELGRNTSWINLQTLHLYNNSIGDKGAAELARNTSWINLQTLDLQFNSIGDKGAAELGRNTSWINLQTLHLQYNSIGDKGAAELGRNTSWINLQTLHLYNNSIGGKGVAELARNTSWINLQTLHLQFNSIGDKGAAELGRNASWINLQTLHLDNNWIGGKGVAELARNTSWINLHTLDLNNNSIGAEGAAELAKNTSWINLQTLHLYNNSIGAEGAAELGRNTSWINLQTLHLQFNSIGDKGAAELGRNTSWINLHTLDLNNNSIGDKGAAELGRNTSWINLQTLNLYLNSIGKKGAVELAKNTSWINLQKLVLTNNWIGAEGAEELGKNTAWPKTLKISY